MLFSFPDTEVQIIPIHNELCEGNLPGFFHEFPLISSRTEFSSPESPSPLCNKPLYSSQNL